MNKFEEMQPFDKPQEEEKKEKRKYVTSKKKHVIEGRPYKRPQLKVSLGRDEKVRFEAKDPKAVLLKAEEAFKKGDFEEAWIKISFVGEEDREKRQKELLEGSDEDKKLAEEMYVNDEWMAEAKNKWQEGEVAADESK